MMIKKRVMTLITLGSGRDKGRVGVMTSKDMTNEMVCYFKVCNIFYIIMDTVVVRYRERQILSRLHGIIMEQQNDTYLTIETNR